MKVQLYFYTKFVFTGNRLHDFDVVVTNTRPRGAVPAYAAANVCVYRKAAFHGRLNLRCGRRVSGRYVMVRLRQAKKQYLTLCEVDVYATAGKFGARAETSQLSSLMVSAFLKNTSQVIIFDPDISSHRVSMKNDIGYFSSTLAILVPFSFFSVPSTWTKGGMCIHVIDIVCLCSNIN